MLFTRTDTRNYARSNFSGRGSTRASSAVLMIALITLVVEASPATAQDTTRTASDSASKVSAATSMHDEEVKRAKEARSGAGIRIGSWNVRDIPTPSGGEMKTSPLYEGYFAKGLDLHLVLDNSVGLWMLEQTTPASGGVLGSGESKSSNYIIPQFTSIRVYPFTRPGDRVEPYAYGGAGFALAITDASGGSLGGGGNQFVVGFGLGGGAGVELRLSDAFGLALGGRYQWLRFTSEVGGLRTLQGVGVTGGITYRFQYR